MFNYNAESGCCPRFDPEKWDGKEFVWQDKLFLRDEVKTFFYVPVNFEKVIVRLWNAAEEAGALTPEPPVCLSLHPSPWKMEIRLEVAKEVPGFENVGMSGHYFCRVFEGPYAKVDKYLREMKEWVTGKGFEAKNLFMWYVYCPKCAKFYGKTLTAIFAET
jgi:hypothetical protein